ncbi:hypothetical protein HPB47_013118, partial [Ixodes persulcatus]
KKADVSQRSEDSFFDKNVAVTDMPAYQLMLGNTVKPTAPEKAALSDHPSQSSTDIENELAAAVTTNQSKEKTRAADKEENGPASNDSSPPEYDVASVNLQNLISEKVRHNVPSLISRKVLGLDMYAESKILKNKTEENDDDDSFFD